MLKDIYSVDVKEVIKEFDSNLNGLSDSQVLENRTKFGNNIIKLQNQKKWYLIFIEQYKDVLMLVLIAASILSIIVSVFPKEEGQYWGSQLLDISGWENFLLIIIVTLINAILGTIQTLKSQKSLNGLKKLSAPKTKVLRNGFNIIIDTQDIVVGDIVILEAGDYIPADGRLIEANSLKVNESSLTGESESLLKEVCTLKKNDLTLGDRINCVFSGCLVVYGRAKFVVTHNGAKSEIGKISILLNEVKEKKTPLQNNLDKLGKFLMCAILVICVILFSLNIIKIGTIGGNPLFIVSESMDFSIALAVAVVPEALGSIVVIVLSISTKKLAKQNAIVKDLKSVEGLGSVSVICSDKTGTLTQNKMTVMDLYINGKLVHENNFSKKENTQIKLLEYGVLCSDATSKDGVLIGDPTEICLIEYFHKNNFSSEDLRKDRKRISELPFDSERMMMSVLFKNSQKYQMITKGAIDKMLGLVSDININGKVRKITEEDKKNIFKANNELASNGKRVLCFATKELNKNTISFSDEKQMTFIGLMSMVDPPRPEVITAIKECKIAGIKPIMITGDHEVTAVAIAKQIGIFNDGDLSMSGLQLSKMSQKELELNINKYTVYARVSPEDKIKIVRAWQSQNLIVSMTGDGVNDAPALKEANIGVAMGITGTEVSKEAASMILTDDNFSTIVESVKLGRNVYNNIKNAIRFLLVGNLATILIAFFITIFALITNINHVPFTAIQLLFLNLLTDSWPAIALGLESYKKNVIFEKPRKANEFFITKPFIKTILVESILMCLIVMITFFIVYYSSAELSNEISFFQASSISFMTLAFCRFFHGFNCKSEKPIILSKEIFSNIWLIVSLFLGFALVSMIYYIPVIAEVFFNNLSTSINYSNFMPFGFLISIMGGSLMLFVFQTIKSFIMIFKFERKI